MGACIGDEKGHFVVEKSMYTNVVNMVYLLMSVEPYTQIIPILLLFLLGVTVKKTAALILLHGQLSYMFLVLLLMLFQVVLTLLL
jgi:hypothetical protein